MVGIWHSDTPRRKVAAAKPVMSPDNTAAERDDEVLAGHACGQQIMVNAFDRGKLLVLLTGGNDCVRHRQGELAFQLLEIQRRHR